MRLDGPQSATGWRRCFLEHVSARSQELQLGSLDLKRAWQGLGIHTVSNCSFCGGTHSSRWKLTNGAIFGHSGLLLCRDGTVMIGRLTAAFLWMGRVGTPFGGGGGCLWKGLERSREWTRTSWVPSRRSASDADTVGTWPNRAKRWIWESKGGTSCSRWGSVLGTNLRLRGGARQPEDVGGQGSRPAPSPAVAVARLAGAGSCRAFATTLAGTCLPLIPKSSKPAGAELVSCGGGRSESAMATCISAL